MNHKRAFVKSMFSRIAPRYDLANRFMTLGMDQSWRRRAAQLCLQARVPRPVLLDIGTGTGDLAIMLSAESPDSRIVGLDLTSEMTDLAHAKLRKMAIARTITLVDGDTLDLPFAPETFHGITSAFVLRNLTSLEGAFAEMARVAKPNARIVALEMTKPRLPVWSTLYRFYFGRVNPLVGGLVARNLDAYRYLPYSLSVFVSAEELAGIMTRAGLRHVGYVLMNLGTVAIHTGIK